MSRGPVPVVLLKNQSDFDDEEAEDLSPELDELSELDDLLSPPELSPPEDEELESAFAAFL